MTVNVTEKAWQTTVIQAFRFAGWYCYHTYSSKRSEPGFPDLVCISPQGRVIFAELKTQRGRLTAEQERVIELLRRGDNEVYVWRPADWPEIERLLNGGR